MSILACVREELCCSKRDRSETGREGGGEDKRSKDPAIETADADSGGLSTRHASTHI